MDLRGDWSSACPALLRNSRRNQVTPGIAAANAIIPQMRAESAASTVPRSLLRRRFSGFHHHQLVFTDAVPAPKRRGLLVFPRVEAGDALFERRKLDDDEAVEFLGTFEDPVAPAAREYFGSVLREDRRNAVGVLPVLDRIVDFGAGYPVGGHGFPLSLREQIQDFARVGDYRIGVPGE